MPSLLSAVGLIPPAAWRWIAILGVLIGAFGTGYFKGREAVQEKFDDYKAAVKAAGDRQNDLTRQTIALNQQRAENAEAKAATLAAERDVATLRLRDIQRTVTSRRIVPPAPSGSNGSDRVCYSRAVLDREFRATFNRAAERLVRIAQEGQRGWDIAVVCRDWAHTVSAEGNR